MTTAHAVKLSDLMDRAGAESRVYRRCADKAAQIGNREAAIWFVEQAGKWDGVYKQASRRMCPCDACKGAC